MLYICIDIVNLRSIKMYYICLKFIKGHKIQYVYNCININMILKPLIKEINDSII